MMGSDHVFARQLNALVARSAVRTTNTMVAQALTDHGCPISAPYLPQLRNGVRRRPAPRYIERIAEYFAVPLSYFYDLPYERSDDSGENRDRERMAISEIDDDDVRRLLLRAHGLSPEAMDLLLQFAKRLNVLG
ncbi:transcriptional regulator [Rhodococcus sp. JT-3]|uniref:transcriptional regulator n=1 Tax=Rhodococcus sp. JT-3 TaxID=1973213 RepID=UPI0013035EB5|nr:transcriptional regulator [Rhodococcus sp. JT-3]